MKNTERGQFIKDLWLVIENLRDMKKLADDYGVGDQIRSAQSRLAAALGHLEGTR